MYMSTVTFDLVAVTVAVRHKAHPGKPRPAMFKAQPTAPQAQERKRLAQPIPFTLFSTLLRLLTNKAWAWQRSKEAISTSHVFQKISTSHHIHAYIALWP